MLDPTQSKAGNITREISAARSVPSPLLAGVAAAAGACADSFVTNPLRVMKTRMQLAVAPKQPVMAVIKSLGVRTAMQGAPVTMSVAMMGTAYCFSTQQAVRGLFVRADGSALPAASFGAGMLAGSSEAALLAPLRRIALLQTSPAHHSSARRAVQALQFIRRNDGLAGLWRGTAITMSRNAFASGTYFTLLQALNGFGRANGGQDAATGMAAGVTTTLVSNPLDTVKTRVQNTVGQAPRALTLASRMYQQEGAAAFMKGSLPAVAKSLPGSAISFTVMKQALYWLQDSEILA